MKSSPIDRIEAFEDAERSETFDVDASLPPLGPIDPIEALDDIECIDTLEDVFNPPPYGFIDCIEAFDDNVYSDDATLSAPHKPPPSPVVAPSG